MRASVVEAPTSTDLDRSVARLRRALAEQQLVERRAAGAAHDGGERRKWKAASRPVLAFGMYLRQVVGAAFPFPGQRLRPRAGSGRSRGRPATLVVASGALALAAYAYTQLAPSAPFLTSERLVRTPGTSVDELDRSGGAQLMRATPPLETGLVSTGVEGAGGRGAVAAPVAPTRAPARDGADSARQAPDASGETGTPSFVDLDAAAADEPPIPEPTEIAAQATASLAVRPTIQLLPPSSGEGALPAAATEGSVAGAAASAAPAATSTPPAAVDSPTATAPPPDTATPTVPSLDTATPTEQEPTATVATWTATPPPTATPLPPTATAALVPTAAPSTATLEAPEQRGRIRDGRRPE